ncbi:hypothetical protein K505DRAFT_344511 [Melanomma pulvis-pyrius CBS 109.77]|uniref:CorA-like transporter domain-containing protein n=1 Tax=Melanomma pulvis-pyrius CBS 109.77 TaxID=1314802 RepID=A0A6A6WNG4_9PLEO|nr:hypothetical protein K505DRAFT_344511 [Melanomma pulvis-pyrius CBS 109.77]
MRKGKANPTFIELVLSFGFKIEEADEYFSSFLFKYKSDISLSYGSIHYVERHGRKKPNDPWAFRKYAVYHRYDHDKRVSAWILLQPRAASQQWLEHRKDWQATQDSWNPLRQHFRFVRSSSSQWRWFLNYLSDELREIRLRVICQSDPRLSSGSDEIDFTKSQALELIEGKTRRARAAIESTIIVTENLALHLEEMTRIQRHSKINHNPQDYRNPLTAEIAQLKSQLELHAHKTRDMIESAKSVNIMVQFYAIGKNSEIDIVAQSIFSTELFHLDPVVFDIRNGVGIFLTLSLTLTACTIAAAFLWIRRETVLARPKASVTP